jgi:chorismate mutase
MSPKNKKKLNKIRIKLDKLDNKLLSLIKNRSNLVKEVLKLKEFKKEIVDQKRIKFILNKINLKSKKLNIDPKITNRIWRNMIWSFIDYEKRNFKK